MDWFRVKGKSNWLTACLAALLPGLGHWYRGVYDKALFITCSFLFHLSLAYTLLHVLVIEQPLTIAYLILVLPYHYFYSIFNSLQDAEGTDASKISIIKLILALSLLLLAIFLVLPINTWYYYKLQIIYHYPMFLLLSVATYFLTHLRGKKSGKWILGRITSIVIVILLAILLWLTVIAPIQWEQWKGILPLVFCTEIFGVFLYRYWKRSSIKLQVDWWGVIVVAILSFTTYFVIQYSDYPTKILQSFHAPSPKQEQLDIEEGYRYELAPIKLPVDEIEDIELRHLNGFVKITQANVEELTVLATLYVNADSEEQALEVKQQSTIDVSFEHGVKLQTYLPLYAKQSYPRMNIEVQIPNDVPITGDLSIKLDHGALQIKTLNILNQLNIETNTANVNVYHLTGDVNIKSKQGNVFLKKTAGDIDIENRKGSITLIDALNNVKATALNGSISISSKFIGGNWDLTATVGNITAKLPENTHYKLFSEVSFGKITGLGITEHDRKEYETSSGAGIHTISLYASNYIHFR